MVKHLLLILPLCLIGYILYQMYLHGVEIKAEEKRKEKIHIEQVQRKKDLQTCLAKEEASIQISIQSNCTVKGLPPNRCRVSAEDMKEIMTRVEENKEICRLEYLE